MKNIIQKTNITEIRKYDKFVIELWATVTVDNINTKYEISTLGRLRNSETDNIIKPCVNPYGYLQVPLYLGNKKKKTCTIHQLVARAFLPNPNGYIEINHIDENKENNTVSNLEWCDRSKNIKSFFDNHKIDHDYMANKHELGHGQRTVTDDQLDRIYYYLMNTNYSVKEISEITGASINTVSKIKSGRSFLHTSKLRGYIPDTSVKRFDFTPYLKVIDSMIRNGASNTFIRKNVPLPIKAEYYRSFLSRRRKKLCV